MKKFIYFVILAVLLVLTGCAADSTGAKEYGDQSVISEVINHNDFDGFEVIGRTAETINVAITPKVPGELVALEVSKGDFVEEGRILGKIEDRDLRKNLELQQKMLEQAKSQVEQTKLQLQKAINEQQNGIVQTNLSLENLRVTMDETARNFERTKALFDSGAVSQSDYEKAEKAATQAKNVYEQEKVKLSNLKSTESIDMLKQGIEQAQASVNLIQTQIQQAQDKVSDTTITAPHAGEVIAINGDVGELVSNQAPLFKIISIDPIKVEMAIKPEELPLSQKGNRAVAEISSLGLTKEATITFVTPIADADGLYTVEATIPNKDQAIKPGMDVRLFIGEDSGGVIISKAAILEDGDGTFVYIVEDGKAVKKTINVLQEMGEEVVVTGVNLGDELIINGQQQVKEGDNITL